VNRKIAGSVNILHVLSGFGRLILIMGCHSRGTGADCSYMISMYSQIWFLSLLKGFFQLRMSSIFVTVGT